MFRKTTLKNNLRVLTQRLDNVKSITVLILAGAGSRYETKNNNGISHFLEHMFFKGAKKYQSTKEVSEAIDSVGGDFNAFTGKEYSGYYVKVASSHADIACDVLSDMLINSKFAPEEINKERGVILEEYNMYQDTPMYQIGWDFEKLVFGDQPLGWDQIGTKKLIQEVTQQDFLSYKNSLYTPDNLIVSIAGDIDHNEAIEKIEKYFVFENHDRKKQLASKFKEIKSNEKIALTHKKTEQAHVVVGFQAYSEEHKYHYAEKVLSIILGGNMSSRMFLSVREAQGLAYYIQTSTDDYTDAGILSTRAGVDLTRLDNAITAIINEYRKIREENVTEKELTKAKEYIKGKLVLQLEDSEQYAHLLGKYDLLYEKIKTPQEIIKGIDKVTIEDIKNVTNELFNEEKLKVAIIGPYDDKGHFENLLKFDN